MRNTLKKVVQKIFTKNAVSKYCDEEVNDNCFNEERNEIISQLVSGEIKPVLKKTRIFIHKYYDKYKPLPIGDLKLKGVNDVSGHVAALDDLLSERYSNKEDLFNNKIGFLKNYISIYSDYRIPHVLLAWEYLKREDYKKAIDWALAACAIDERCMPSWHIMKTAFLSLRASGRLREYLSDAEIKHLEPLGYDLRGKICPLAFERIFVQSTGEVMCCCPPLVPVAIGNAFEDSNWREIINSEAAREIRNSIINGSYKYCNRLTCQEIRNKDGNTFLFDKNKSYTDTYDDKYFNLSKNDLINNFKSNLKIKNISTIDILNLGFDETCNLHCPQCRKGFIFPTENKKNKLDHLAKQIIPDMVLSSRKIVLANTGDPFASKYYRKVLKTISASTHTNLISITIFTNGLLLNSKMWEELSNIHPFNIGIAVSVDAMSKKTYEKVRPPGKWETLVENLTFISQLKRENKIKYLELEYVIQECNFREIKDFTLWALNELSVSRVVFHRLINTGTYSDDDYQSRAVFNEQHQYHREFLEVLNDPIFRNNQVSFTDLGHLIKN
jgi:MoaA/NifB/PqqE/SkfB family radical SAM enzyme